LHPTLAVLSDAAAAHGAGARAQEQVDLAKAAHIPVAAMNDRIGERAR
jgi:hypothetical protein